MSKNLNETSELEEKEVNTYEYKCPECGAPMHYDPESFTLRCDYCQNKIQLTSTYTNKEFEFNNNLDTDTSWNNDVHVFKCQQCGAENVFAKKELSQKCPFCGSIQVIKSNEVAGLKPNRVIPFHVTNEQAKEAYVALVKKKMFAPKKVKKMEMELDTNGVYCPSWTYDADTFSSYEGKLGEDYKVTVGSGKNRHTETRTRWFKVSGTIRVGFDDVLVNAGNNINGKDLGKITPFGTNESLVYSEEFLAGFSAEHYSKDVKTGFDEAKNTMNNTIRSRILDQYDYDHVDYLNIKTSYADITYKYVLLPIWIGLFTYGSKNFKFYVNGESGKATGKYPKSGIRITIFVFILLILTILFFWWLYSD